MRPKIKGNKLRVADKMRDITKKTLLPDLFPLSEKFCYNSYPILLANLLRYKDVCKSVKEVMAKVVRKPVGKKISLYFFD